MPDILQEFTAVEDTESQDSGFLEDFGNRFRGAFERVAGGVRPVVEGVETIESHLAALEDRVGRMKLMENIGPQLAGEVDHIANSMSEWRGVQERFVNQNRAYNLSLSDTKSNMSGLGGQVSVLTRQLKSLHEVIGVSARVADPQKVVGEEFSRKADEVEQYTKQIKDLQSERKKLAGEIEPVRAVGGGTPVDYTAQNQEIDQLSESWSDLDKKRRVVMSGVESRRDAGTGDAEWYSQQLQEHKGFTDEMEKVAAERNRLQQSLTEIQQIEISGIDPTDAQRFEDDLKVLKEYDKEISDVSAKRQRLETELSDKEGRLGVYKQPVQKQAEMTAHAADYTESVNSVRKLQRTVRENLKSVEDIVGRVEQRISSGVDELTAYAHAENEIAEASDRLARSQRQLHSRVQDTVDKGRGLVTSEDAGYYSELGEKALTTTKGMMALGVTDRPATSERVSVGASGDPESTKRSVQDVKGSVDTIVDSISRGRNRIQAMGGILQSGDVDSEVFTQVKDQMERSGVAATFLSQQFDELFRESRRDFPNFERMNEVLSTLIRGTSRYIDLAGGMDDVLEQAGREANLSTEDLKRFNAELKEYRRLNVGAVAGSSMLMKGGRGGLEVPAEGTIDKIRNRVGSLVGGTLGGDEGVLGNIARSEGSVHAMQKLLGQADITPESSTEIQDLLAKVGRQFDAEKFAGGGVGVESVFKELNDELDSTIPNVQRLHVLIEKMVSEIQEYGKRAKRVVKPLEQGVPLIAGAHGGEDSASDLFNRFLGHGDDVMRVIPQLRSIQKELPDRHAGTETGVETARYAQETKAMTGRGKGYLSSLGERTGALSGGLSEVGDSVGHFIEGIAEGKTELVQHKGLLQGLEMTLGGVDDELEGIYDELQKYASALHESGNMTDAQKQAILGYKNQVEQARGAVAGFMEVMDTSKLSGWAGSVKQLFVPLDGLINRLEKIGLTGGKIPVSAANVQTTVGNVRHKIAQSAQNIVQSEVRPDQTYIGSTKRYAEAIGTPGEHEGGVQGPKGFANPFRFVEDPDRGKRVAEYSKKLGEEVKDEEVTVEGLRQEHVQMYGRMLEKQYREGVKTAEDFGKLYGKQLMCSCAPALCHGDILAKWVDHSFNQLSKETQQDILRALPSEAQVRKTLGPDELKRKTKIDATLDRLLPGLVPDTGGGAADPEWKQRQDREERRADVDVTGKLTGKTQVKEIAVPGVGKQLARRVDVDVPQEYTELDDEGEPDSKEVVNAVKRVHQRVADQLGIALNQVLEVSTAGMNELGQKLSAFNLKMNIGGKDYSVESLYQGSKVFDDGKALHDLYEAEPGKAKGDPRVKGKRAKSFDFFGQKFEADDQHSFYNWLYTNALTQQYPDAGKDLTKYKAFTDLYSGKGGAMQSEAVAMASTLEKQGKLTPGFVARPENLGAVLRDPDKADGPKEPSALEGKVFAKIFPGMENLSADIQAILRETPLFKNALQDARESIQQWARIKANPKQLRSIMELLHGGKLKDKSFKVLSESPGRLPPGPLADTAKEFRKVMTDARERGIGISTLHRELIEKSGRGVGPDKGDSDIEQRGSTRKGVMTFGGKRSQDEGVLVEAIRRLIAERFIDKRPHSEPYPVQMKNIMEGGKFKKLIGKRDTAESLLGVLHPDLDEKRRMEYADVGRAGEMVDLTKDENADIRRQIEQEERDRLKKSKDRADRMVVGARGRKGEKGLAPALRYQEKVQKLIDLFEDEGKRVDQMYRKLRARKLKQGARSGRTAQYNQRLAEVRKEVEGSDVYKDVAGKFKLPPQLRAVKEYVQKTVEFVRGIAPDLSGFKLDTRGRTDLLEEPGIAVIGNRKPPPGARGKGEQNFAYGVAERIGERLAQQGVNVVSGLAAGTDTAAHRGALKAGGTTTMVPATGLGKDVLSKQVNSILVPLLTKGQHLFASMFKKDTPWSGKRAMDRNELVRALSDAVVAVGVSEKKGGSYQMGLDTIRQGKPLYVISPEDLPGKQEGGRDLIAKGGQEVSLKALRDKGVGIFTGDAGDRKWRQSQRDIETGQRSLFGQEPDPLKREDSVRDYYQQIRKEVQRRIGDKVKNIAKGVTDAVATQLEIPFGKVEARVKQTVKAVKAPTKSDPGGQMMLFDQPDIGGPDARDVKHIKSLRKDIEGIRELGGLRKVFGEIDLSDTQQALSVLRQMETLLGKMGLSKTGAQGSGKVVSMLGTDFDEAQREVRNLYRHVDALQTLFKDTSGDTGYLGKKVEDLDGSFSQLDSVADRLISSVTELDARLGTKKSLIPTTAELKDNIEALSGSLTKLGRDADKSGDQIEGELEDPLQRVIRTLNQLRGMEGVKADSPAVKGMPRQVERLRENMGDLTTAQAGLNKLMESGESDADVLRQSYNAMDSSVESLRSNIRSLGSQLEYVENSTDGSTRSTDQYKQAVAETKGQLRVYDNQLNDVEEQLRQVRITTDGSAKGTDEFDKAVTQAKSGLGAYDDELNQVRMSTDEVTDSIEKKTAATKKDTEATKKAAGARSAPGRAQKGRGGFFKRLWADTSPSAPSPIERQEGPAMGDMDRKKIAGTDVADFKKISFVDLFASMEMFERVYHLFQQFGQITSEFGFQMARVGGIAGAVGNDFQRLEGFARDMGATTIFTASESAEAMEELAKVGFSASEIISTLPSVLNVAAAEGMKLAQAAEILAANLKAFQLVGAEAGRMSNVLAAASMRSAATMADFGVGLRTVATFAHSAGVSIEETVTMLGKLADAGLTPRRASVALRAMIQQLQRLERSRSRQELSRIGLTMTDIDPKIVGLTTSIGRLSDAMQTFGSDADDIFTIRASHAFQILSQVGEGALRRFQRGITDTTAAADLAGRQMDTFYGTIRRLQSVWEEFQISMGLGMKPVISFFADLTITVMGFVSNLNNGLKASVGFLGLAGGAVFAFGNALAVLTYSQGLVFDQWKNIMRFVRAHPYVAAFAVAIPVIIGLYGWVKKLMGAEEERARRNREALREEINTREELLGKIEQQQNRLKWDIFTDVDKEKMQEAADRVGEALDELGVKFNEAGNIVYETRSALLSFIRTMREGELDFPVLKKLQEELARTRQEMFDFFEKGEIRGVLADIGASGIEGSERFRGVRPTYTPAGGIEFRDADDQKLSSDDNARLLSLIQNLIDGGNEKLLKEGLTIQAKSVQDVVKGIANVITPKDAYKLVPGAELGVGHDTFIRQRAPVVAEKAREITQGWADSVEQLYADVVAEAEKHGVGEGYRRINTVVNEWLANTFDTISDGLSDDKKNEFQPVFNEFRNQLRTFLQTRLDLGVLTGGVEPGAPAGIRGKSARGTDRTYNEVMGSYYANVKSINDFFDSQLVGPIKARVQDIEMGIDKAIKSSVVDGDTIKVDFGDDFKRKSEIRILGVDTTESRKGNVPEPLSKEATKAFIEWVRKAEGYFELVGYGGGSTYGRDVADVRNVEGERWSEELVRQGFAEVPTFPADNMQKLLDLEAEAILNRRGVWADEQQVRQFFSPESLQRFEEVTKGGKALQVAAAELSGAISYDKVAAPVGARVDSRSVAPDDKGAAVPLGARVDYRSPVSDDKMSAYTRENVGLIGMDASKTLEDFRKLEAEMFWFRNKYRKKDLAKLEALLQNALRVYAALRKGAEDRDAFVVDPEDKKKLIKDISKLQDAIQQRREELDKEMRSQYGDWFKARLEYIENLSQIEGFDIDPIVNRLRKKIESDRSKFPIVDGDDLIDSLHLDLAKTLRGVGKHYQSVTKGRQGDLRTRGTNFVRILSEEMDDISELVVGQDAAGILEVIQSLGDYVRTYQPSVDKLPQEFIDRFDSKVHSVLTGLFATLDRELTSNLRDADTADISEAIRTLSDFYDGLSDFGGTFDFVDGRSVDLEKIGQKITDSIGKLSSAQIDSFTRDLEDVGFAGLEQRIYAVDWLQDGLDKLGGRLADIPETMWNKMVAGLIPKIEDARERLTADTLAKLKESIKARFDKDPALDMDEVVERYGDMIDLLDPKQTAELFDFVGLNISEYQDKLEEIRTSDFSQAIKVFGEGLDRFSDLLPGVAHRLIDEEMAKLTNRVLNEATRRAAVPGNIRSFGMILGELQAEAATAFNALARKQAAIDMKEYTGRLWESIGTVSRGGFVGMGNLDRPSQVVEQSRRDMGIGENLRDRAVLPELPSVDLESLPRVEFAENLKGSVDGVVEKLTTGVERVVRSATIPLLDVTQTLAGGHNLLEGFKHSFVREGQIQTDLIEAEAKRLNMTYLEFLAAFAAPLAQLSNELGKKQEELERGQDELGVFDKLMSIGPTETGGKSFEERHGSPFREPFFRTPSQYEGHYLKQEESRIGLAKAQVKIDFAGSKDLIDYETGKLDKELEEIKAFRGQQGNIRDVMGMLQERFDKSDLGDTTLFGGKLGTIFEDLLSIEAHLDLTEHLHKLGDTAERVSDGLTSFIQRMDQTSSIVNLFGNFMKTAGSSTKVLVASLASGVAALASGEGGTGAAVGILGGVLGGIGGAFFGDPLTGASLGSSLFSSLYNVFFDKAEAEAEAEDSLGNADPGIAGKVDVRNTTIHIGSIVHDNMFNVTETVDPRRISEELAGYTEADLREIVV